MNKLTGEQRKTIAFQHGLNSKPEDIPTVDELPQTDISDLLASYQYQSTIDEDFVA